MITLTFGSTSTAEAEKSSEDLKLFAKMALVVVVGFPLLQLEPFQMVVCFCAFNLLFCPNIG